MISVELLQIVAHSEETVSHWDEYTNLLRDPAHWGFELTLQFLIDFLIIGIGWKLVQKWVKRHDKEHHDHDCDIDDNNSSEDT